MDQDIRFCTLDGRRIAYATVGEGPPVVFGAKWVSHLEEEWDDPRARSFYEDLAQNHLVVRYDRLGAGLSDRDIPLPPTVATETRVLETVIDATGGGAPATVFACSCAAIVTASLAARSPERVDKVVFFGSYVSREDLPEVTRRSLIDFVRANWGLAAQMLAGLILPHASGDEIAALSRHKRRAADADIAAAFLELELFGDARPLLPHLTMPALVLHRRGDRAVPIARGRELASLLPNARFIALSGDSHLPHVDDQREVQRALAGFLDDPAPAATNGDSPLSRREAEVLRLVAAGLSNREIASSLVLSEHTVHRHMANILRKLTQSSRAAAAAHATRVGYI
jgi:pimeloyl-ACP methyl ester carboxylesterase/DNA-binding CsgD family transcriptional regulator